MAQTIRKSVFETNSSSSHSITIGIGTEWDNIIPNEKGNIILEGGEFGWECDSFNDALTKANYCAIDFLHDKELIEQLKRVIKDYTNCNKVKIKADESYESPNWSYIDHQSSGTIRSRYFTDEELKNFIFNKSCILYTDNDNH